MEIKNWMILRSFEKQQRKLQYARRMKIVLSVLIAMHVLLIGGLFWMHHTSKNGLPDLASIETAPIAVQSAARTSSQVKLPTVSSTRKSPFHEAQSSAPVVETMPQTNWRSPNGGVKVHTVSSATVHSIGGGGSSGAVAHVSSVSTPAASYSATSFGTTSALRTGSLSWISSRNLTAANTLSSETAVIENNSPNAKPGIRRDGWDDYDQDEEPFPDPVGEGLWTLLCLVAAYGVSILYRRKQRL